MDSSASISIWFKLGNVLSMSWTAFSGRGIPLGDFVDDEAAVAENQSQNASTLVVIDDETKESSTEALSTRAPLPEIDLDHEASIRQRMTDLTEAMHEFSFHLLQQHGVGESSHQAP